ncbi:MAG: hypothetical protein FWE15_19210 [Actinomycetia bacterium]|nr:hypothetical protein [Actinomycetes bacterium]MCL2732143.1 hypothetical protein [Actinomycetes bacterium]
MSSFDFEAADWLSRQLVQLAAKIEWFAWLRDQQQKKMLGTSDSDNWQGSRRQQFDDKFSGEQAALGQLAQAARQLKSNVDTAIGEAHAEAQRKRHH